METIQISMETTLMPVEQTKIIVVCDDESLKMAHSLLEDIKALRKQIEATFKPLAQKAHEAHKKVKEQWAKAEAPLIEAENKIKASIKKYLDEVEIRRSEEELKLQELARKQEEERRLQEALIAEAEGNHAEAEAILNEPIIPIPVPVVKPIVKVDGRYFKKNYKAKVIDFPALVEYAYTTKQFNLLLPNESALNTMARALKENLNVSGVTVIIE